MAMLSGQSLSHTLSLKFMNAKVSEQHPFSSALKKRERTREGDDSSSQLRPISPPEAETVSFLAVQRFFVLSLALCLSNSLPLSTFSRSLSPSLLSLSSPCIILSLSLSVPVLVLSDRSSSSWSSAHCGPGEIRQWRTPL